MLKDYQIHFTLLKTNRIRFERLIMIENLGCILGSFYLRLSCDIMCIAENLAKTLLKTSFIPSLKV